PDGRGGGTVGVGRARFPRSPRSIAPEATPFAIRLVFGSVQTHIVAMAANAKKKIRSQRPAEKSFVYRGVRILPATGRRSPLAQSIRDGLRAMSEQPRGKRAEA